jgi:hypothetical protein
LKNFILRWPIRNFTICPLLLLLLGLSACAPAAKATPHGLQASTVDNETAEFETGSVPSTINRSPEAKPSKMKSDCPALDSQLTQLLQSEDPAGQAEQLGYRVKEGKIQVLLTLLAENTDFLAGYGAELGTQSGSQVQAFVPFDQLCELAKHPDVQSIRPTAQFNP